MITCGKEDRKDLRWMLQKTAKNILWHGECSCLQHCKFLYSWGRITQTICTPKIQKISQWNNFSTYLRNCCPNAHFCRVANGNTFFPEDFDVHDKEIDGVATIHFEILVVAPQRDSTRCRLEGLSCLPLTFQHVTIRSLWLFAFHGLTCLSLSFVTKTWSIAKEAVPICKRCNERRRKTFFDLENVHVCNIGISGNHGKELLRQFSFNEKHRRSHNETNVRHICKIGVRTRWDLWSENKTVKILHGNIYLRLVNKSAVSRTQRSTSFQILYSVFVRYTRTPNQTLHRKIDGRGSKVHQNTGLFGQWTASQWNSSGIFSKDSPHCSSATEVQELLSRLSIQPEEFTGRIIFMSMFNDISWGSQDNEQECELSAQLVSICAIRFSPGKWTFLGLGSDKKWYSTHEYKPQGNWDRVAELMTLKLAESGHPVFPCYESIVTRNAQKQRWWKVANTFLRWPLNDWNCFSHIYFC